MPLRTGTTDYHQLGSYFAFHADVLDQHNIGACRVAALHTTMHVEQLYFTGGQWWSANDGGEPAVGAQLVIVFGEREVLRQDAFREPLAARFPQAMVVSCSGGGAILGGHVLDHGLIATAVRFQRSHVHGAVMELASADASECVGENLARRLPAAQLRHVLVLAEGLRVNGSALARGLARGLPAGTTVTGGLAADGERFEDTIVGLDDRPSRHRVVAVGLYGDALRIGIGSFGGWDVFGTDRRITRAVGNTLMELDGQPALAVYRELLGPLGHALPASGLLFPLKVRDSPEAPGVIRTILAVDEAAGSVTFAGDVPEGSFARLVRTDLDKLIDAAGTAAERSGGATNASGHSLALAVSCIGRKLLLQRRVDEELAKVRNVLGENTRLTGFYSYGELAPSGPEAPCELHNQTMTLTTLSEA